MELTHKKNSSKREEEESKYNLKTSLFDLSGNALLDKIIYNIKGKEGKREEKTNDS